MADPTHAEVEAALAILAAAEAARAAEALRAAEAAAAPAVAPAVAPIAVAAPTATITPASPVPPPASTTHPLIARISSILAETLGTLAAYEKLPNVSGFENDALARAFVAQQLNALNAALYPAT